MGVMVRDVSAVASWEAELKTMAPYVRFLANALKLADYRFDIVAEHGDGTYYARVICVDCRRVATVHLTADFFNATPEIQKHTLVHELVHRILHDVQVVADGLERHLGMSWEFFHTTHDNSVERCTDWLADAISPMLPTLEEWRADQVVKDHGFPMT